MPPPLERDRRPLLQSLFVCVCFWISSLVDHLFQCVYCVSVSRSLGQYHRCARVTRLCLSHCQHLAVTVAPGKHVVQLNCGLVLVFSLVQCQWSLRIFFQTCQDTGFAPASKRYMSQTVFTSFLLRWLSGLSHTSCCLDIRLLAHCVSILVACLVFVLLLFVSGLFDPDWIHLRCSLCFKKLCSQEVQSLLSVDSSLSSIWSCEDLSFEIDSETLFNETPDAERAPFHVHDLELYRSYLSALQSKTNSSSSVSRYLAAICVAHRSSVRPWNKKTVVGELRAAHVVVCTTVWENFYL